MHIGGSTEMMSISTFVILDKVFTKFFTIVPSQKFTKWPSFGAEQQIGSRKENLFF